jgi:hypothetical protein
MQIVEKDCESIKRQNSQFRLEISVLGARVSSSQSTAQSPTTPGAAVHSKSVWRGAWIQGLSTVIAVIVGFGLNYLVGPHPAAASSPPILGSFITPGNNDTIGNVVPTLSGHVSGLKPGEMVWTFNESQSQRNTYFPNSGPCEVSAGVWTCHDIYIGPAASSKNPNLGKGNYQIYAVIVTDQDAFDIVDHLRCNPTPKSPCTQTYSTLPGNDIAPAQSVTVDRTR